MVEVVLPYRQLDYDQVEPGSVFIAAHADDGQAILCIKAIWEYQDLLVVLSQHENLQRRTPIVIGANHIRRGRVLVISEAKLLIDHALESTHLDRSATTDRDMIGAICMRRGGAMYLAAHGPNQSARVAYLDLASGAVAQAAPSGTWFHRWSIVRPCLSKGWETVSLFPPAS